MSDLAKSHNGRRFLLAAVYKRMMVTGAAVVCTCSVLHGQPFGLNKNEGSGTREPLKRHSSKSIANEADEFGLREGTEPTNFDGYFTITGNRITFYPKDLQVRFRSLANLALKRVARVLGDSNNPGRLKWSVDGVITEYQGENYLMITRAAITSRHSDS